MIIRSRPHGARGTVVPRTTPGNLSSAMVLGTTLANFMEKSLKFMEKSLKFN
jgi:hypothetical protein